MQCVVPWFNEYYAPNTAHFRVFWKLTKPRVPIHSRFTIICQIQHVTRVPGSLAADEASLLLSEDARPVAVAVPGPVSLSRKSRIPRIRSFFNFCGFGHNMDHLSSRKKKVPFCMENVEIIHEGFTKTVRTK